MCNGYSKTFTESQMHVAAGAGQQRFWLKTKWVKTQVMC